MSAKDGGVVGKLVIILPVVWWDPPSKWGSAAPITLSPPAVTSVARKHAWGEPQAEPEKMQENLPLFVVFKVKRSNGCWFKV